jgi:hypothetical protein
MQNLNNSKVTQNTLIEDLSQIWDRANTLAFAENLESVPLPTQQDVLDKRWLTDLNFWVDKGFNLREAELALFVSRFRKENLPTQYHDLWERCWRSLDTQLEF